MTEAQPAEPSAITEVTRRDIFDAIGTSGVSWSGRMNEPEFLARLYDLTKMPSNDLRFEDAASDISQHRVSYKDGESDWVFSDRRFNLLGGPDAELIRFLCEMLHPLVRPDAREVERLEGIFNERLGKDGWEIYAATTISGRPVFAGRRVAVQVDHAIAAVKTAADPIAAEYLNRQITRMYAATQGDPELAIGTAKEMLETVCKSILEERTGSHPATLELPALLKATMKELSLAPEDVPDAAKGAESIRVLLNSLGTVAGRIAELRNLYGTGHGKAVSARALEARHARLAVGAAATLATFLFETHQEPASRRVP